MFNQSQFYEITYNNRMKKEEVEKKKIARERYKCIVI